MSKKLKYILASLRVLLGFLFLWAFLDKTFGLRYSTEPDASWLSGTSPTEGFLRFGTQDGVFGRYFQSLADSPWVDWLFMLGLFGVGTSLILGIAMRLAVIFGTVLLSLLWLAMLPLENNPIIDNHVIYALLLVTLLFADDNQAFGFGRQWRELSLVRKFSILK